jgi:beta-phosphoglucomutase-like phosphatase (HAD superfamily)
LKAADLLGIRPENCLVIEDAVNWIQAAISAWMKSLGKIWEHTDEELKIANKTFTDFKKITLLELEKIRWKSLWKF